MGEEAPEKTLRELYEPDVHQRPIGFNGEDLHKYLRDFSWACDLLRPHKGEVSKVVSCSVCGMQGHHNDQCPKIKEVSAMGGFIRNDSQSNAYNSGWRNHPNLRWGSQEPKPTNTSSSSSSS
ncbi:retrotransposon gag protein [Cucumis melo var. makuwa]|uniref:Retrotransposon gag protein n=1 Tax=Cucumis melo var. makuwa TaxID=1194695 RepID=A0A5A7SR51_CUCMM|nr:retrotransposon gag protein [Cucumis melo var. makuwa]TYK16852.1 retrotransposon gag protein [Cucumis melo var. makuwa]